LKASFPTEFTGNLLGKSREAGEFETPEGKVSYGQAYELSFESSEGLVQTVRVGQQALDKAADFDVAKAPKFAAIHVRGDVHITDQRGSFRPTEVRLVKAS
jgi:hypothetical protein